MKYIIVVCTDNERVARSIVGVADETLQFDKDNDISYYLPKMLYNADNLLIYTDKEEEE